MDKKPVVKEETAIFAGGCFWGVEEYFSRVKGVLKSESGYSGGTTKNPVTNRYAPEQQDMRESVRVVFDPTVVTTSGC